MKNFDNIKMHGTTVKKKRTLFLVWGKKDNRMLSTILRQYTSILQKQNKKNARIQEGKEEGEGDYVAAAMIATTVVKGIAGGQWAFAVFDDGRNDCTSL
jgi:ribosomal protein L16/L10AE